MSLFASGRSTCPCATFRDDDLLDPGSDPLIALLGSLSNLRDGERIVSRLLLRSLGPDWSEPYQEKAFKKPVEERRDPSYRYETGPLHTDGITMAILGVGALGALRGYFWYRDGETWKTVLLGLGVFAGVTLLGWARWRWKKARSRVYDPQLIREKVSRIAFDAEIQVTAILPREGTRPPGRGSSWGRWPAAYRHYDHPAGARFRVGRIRRAPSRPACVLASLRDGPLPSGTASWGCGRWPPCGTRPGPGTRRPWWSAPGPGCCCPRQGESGKGPPVGVTTAGKIQEIMLLRRPAASTPPLHRPHPHGQVHS